MKFCDHLDPQIKAIVDYLGPFGEYSLFKGSRVEFRVAILHTSRC